MKKKKKYWYHAARWLSYEKGNTIWKMLK